MIAQKQAMMAVHEVLDGRFSVLTEDLDAGGFSVVNARDPVDAQDVTTKSYVDSLAQPEAVLAAQAAQAAAEAAQTATAIVAATASGYKDAASASAIAAATSLSGALTAQAAAEAAAAALSNVALYSSRSALAASTVGSAVTHALCLAYASAGDCSAFVMKRVATAPDYGGVRSVDRFLPNGTTDSTNGGWWIYVPSAAGVDVCAFGYKADWTNDDNTATDNTTSLQNAINFAGLGFGTGVDSGGGCGTDVLLPKGTAVIANPFIVHDGVRVLGKGVFATLLKMKDSTFPASSNFCRLGTPGSIYDICDTQTRASAGDLIINGTYNVGGVAKFLTLRPVVIFSVGNDTGRTFTVYGTDAFGSAVSNTVTGANGNIAETTIGFRSVTRVSVNGATAGNVAVGTKNVASFGSRLEQLQIFSGATNATSGTAIVYTDNAQHTAGLKCVKIFAGNRHAAKFEIGYGGASIFVFEDVETFNKGNVGASNNSSIYLNYAGLLSPLRNLVVQGPGAPGGAASVGIQVVGGNVVIDGLHVEGIATGVRNEITNVNNGTLEIRNANGHSTVTNLIQITAGAASGSTYVSRIFPASSAKTVDNKGTPVTGNILAWTTY
jgi:glutamine amidotransferase-like uncharacterized protein